MRARFTLVIAFAGLVGCPRAPERNPSEWPIARAELERSIPTDDPAETSYRTNCLPCHGVDGRGAGSVTGADFTSPTGPLTRPDAELLVSIRDGRRGTIGLMPAHRAILGEEGSVAVLAYVRRTFGAGIVPRAAEIVAGDELSDPFGTAGMVDERALPPGTIEALIEAAGGAPSPPAGSTGTAP